MEIDFTFVLKATSVFIAGSLGIAGIYLEHNKQKKLSLRTKSFMAGILVSSILGVIITYFDSESQHKKDLRNAERWQKNFDALATSIQKQRKLTDQSSKQITQLENLNGFVTELQGKQKEFLEHQNGLSNQARRLNSELTKTEMTVINSQENIKMQQAQFSDLFLRMSNPLIPAKVSIEMSLSLKSPIFNETRDYIKRMSSIDNNTTTTPLKSNLKFDNRDLSGSLSFIAAENYAINRETGKIKKLSVRDFYIPADSDFFYAAPKFLAVFEIELSLYEGIKFDGAFNQQRRIQKIDNAFSHQSDVDLLLTRRKLPSRYDSISPHKLPSNQLSFKGINEYYEVDNEREIVSVVMVGDIKIRKTNKAIISPLDFKNMLAAARFRNLSQINKNKEVIESIERMIVTIHSGQGFMQEKRFQFDSNNIKRVREDYEAIIYAQGAN
jgi:hypothetical protein